MFKANAVREVAVVASKTIDYEGMKSEQLQIVESFVTARGVFRVLPLYTERVFAAPQAQQSQNL